MTRSHEKGENEITDEARRRAGRSGKNICELLQEMLREAKAARDKLRERKVRRAQKYLGCRNKRKRGKTQ